MKKRLGDAVMSCLFVVLGVIAIVVIQRQNSSAINNTGTTTFRTFPTFYGILIIALSSLNLISIGVKASKERRSGSAKDELTEKTDLVSNRIVTLRTIGMFLLSLAFALLLKKLHFALLCFCFLFLSFLLLGQKKVWLNALVAALGSGLIYLVFVVLLKLPI